MTYDSATDWGFLGLPSGKGRQAIADDPTINLNDITPWGHGDPFMPFPEDADADPRPPRIRWRPGKPTAEGDADPGITDNEPIVAGEPGDVIINTDGGDDETLYVYDSVGGYKYVASPEDQCLRADGDTYMPVAPLRLQAWHNQDCTYVSMYNYINDESDLTYIRFGCDIYGGGSPNQSARGIVSLDNPTRVPTNSIGVTVTTRMNSEILEGDWNTNIEVGLYQGAVRISRMFWDVTGAAYTAGIVRDAWVDLSWELSEVEFGNITDFDDLRLLFYGTGGHVSYGIGDDHTATTIYISDAYVDFPG